MRSRDLGASVRQRLLNRSRLENRPLQELLQYFAMERFLYRLSRSRFADRFVLKGALLLTAWRAPMSRPTIDIDLAGRTSNELDHVHALLVEVLPRRPSRMGSSLQRIRCESLESARMPTTKAFAASFMPRLQGLVLRCK